MSHITTMALVITDLAALKSAVRELGAELVAASTFASYQHGLVCEHKIKLPGCSYEIGVQKQNDGGYKLAFDFFSEGQKLQAKFGAGCKKIAQMYAVHKATAEARRKGYTVRREVGKNGTIKLQVTGV